MSVEPVQRVNRVDFVVVLVTGVLLEISILPLLPLERIITAAEDIPQVSMSGPSFRVALFSALVLAHTAGRLINVVTTRL